MYIGRGRPSILERAVQQSGLGTSEVFRRSFGKEDRQVDRQFVGMWFIYIYILNISLQQQLMEWTDIVPLELTSSDG